MKRPVVKPSSAMNKPRTPGILALMLVAAVASVLAGCATDNSDLDAWMIQTRQDVRPSVAKIPEPKRFVPFRYEASLDLDPFSNSKLQVALARYTERNKGGIKPDLERRREPLENYPLDTIRMVGHMQKASQGAVALVEVDKVVFQARPGQYIGQNFGRITRISETEVGIKEMVQDAAGDWVEREASLQLQEAK